METTTELQKANQEKAGVQVEVITEPVNPVPEAVVEPSAQIKEVAESLVTRASKVQLTEPKKEADNPFGLTSEDFQKVTTDPVLSKYYKSMLSDYTKKTMIVADEKKTVEAKLAEMSTWSKDRVKTLQSDPAFLKAAQEVLAEQNPPNSGYTDEAWSNLDPEVKRRLQINEQRILELEQKSQLQNQLVELKHQDETLKTRYANYNPEAVDIITNDLLTGKVRATREDLWKVFDYEPMAKRCYELGKQDGMTERQEKTQSISTDGFTNVQTTKEIPKPETNESTKNYFGRLVMQNLSRRK